MKKDQIKVGGVYEAMVSGKLVPVRVDAVRDWDTSVGSGTRYDVTNLKTGRKTTFRSAAKFRRGLPSPKPTNVEEVTGRVIAGEKGLKVAETEQRPAGFGGQYESPPATDCGPLPVVPRGLAEKLARTEVVEDTAPHLIVEARAGTGKTTTLVEGVKRLMGVGSTLTPSPQQAMVWDCMELSKGKAKTVCFVAFNRSIAAELKTRVPAGCEAMTMHGLGLRAVRAAFRLFGGEGGVSEWRVRNIIGELVGRDVRDFQRENPVLVKAVEELVGLCKMNLVMHTVSPATEFTWEEELDRLASHYEVELNGQREKVYDLVPRVLERCKQVDKDGCVDYDDMIWLPVVLGLPVRKFDVLLVDEAQDLNRCQQALAKMAGRRLVLCGDPKQAIYGFAGADAESMKRMEQELGQTDRGCVRLPLTVTRRCGKAIVREANKIVADFEAFESNGPGKVTKAPFKGEDTPRPVSQMNDEFMAKEGIKPKDQPKESYRLMVKDGDMVLCRVNAPLVSECFRFIKAGRKANIQGRDVGKGLVNTVKKLAGGEDRLGSCKVEDLIAALGLWLESEQKKEAAKKFPSEAKMIALQDKHDCLLCFTEGLGTAFALDVVRKIESVFTDDRSVRGIRLSSIHKAKGLEAHRVFLLEPEGATIPHPMAKSRWQVEQEWNLRYVAITRAIEELVYVS